MKCPKRVAVIGVVFCLLGAEALWSTVADLMASKVRPDLFVFCLPVGVGLLRGKPSSQWWAWIWIIIGYAMNTASIVLMAFFLGPESITGKFVGGNHHAEVLAPYFMAGHAVLLIFIFVAHKLLYSKKSMDYFNRDGEKPNLGVSEQ